MLKVFSFKFDDADGINNVLSKYPLAKGASVFVSNGELIIPVDDGERPSKSLRISRIKEMINSDLDKINEYVHQQKTKKIKMDGVKIQLSKLEEDLKKVEEDTSLPNKEKYDQKKVIDLEVKRLNNVLDQTGNQILMTQAEITELMTGINAYELEIKELESGDESTESAS